MYFVYILQSLKDGRYYIGSTDDMARRLREHNSGQQAATRYRTPLRVVYIERFPDRKAARRRELYIKAQKSRRYIEKLITGRDIAKQDEIE